MVLSNGDNINELKGYSLVKQRVGGGLLYMLLDDRGEEVYIKRRVCVRETNPIVPNGDERVYILHEGRKIETILVKVLEDVPCYVGPNGKPYPIEEANLIRA